MSAAWARAGERGGDAASGRGPSGAVLCGAPRQRRCPFVVVARGRRTTARAAAARTASLGSSERRCRSVAHAAAVAAGACASDRPASAAARTWARARASTRTLQRGPLTAPGSCSRPAMRPEALAASIRFVLTAVEELRERPHVVASADVPSAHAACARTDASACARSDRTRTRARGSSPCPPRSVAAVRGIVLGIGARGEGAEGVDRPGYTRATDRAGDRVALRARGELELVDRRETPREELRSDRDARGSPRARRGRRCDRPPPRRAPPGSRRAQAPSPASARATAAWRRTPGSPSPSASMIGSRSSGRAAAAGPSVPMASIAASLTVAPFARASAESTGAARPAPVRPRRRAIGAAFRSGPRRVSRSSAAVNGSTARPSGVAGSRSAPAASSAWSRTKWARDPR